MPPTTPEPPSDLPRISSAEWSVMRVVWARGAASAQDVAASLDDTTDWSDRTVKTLLSRLVKKGALGYEVEGKRYRYHALLSRDECVQAESESFLERVFGGAVSPLLASFVRGGKLSKAEIAELRHLLDEEEA